MKEFNPYKKDDKKNKRDLIITLFGFIIFIVLIILSISGYFDFK